MRVSLSFVVLSLAVTPLVGQRYMPPEALIAEFERQRGVILEFINVIPDSAMAFRPTPGVRTFAEQIEHIVVSNLFVGSMVMSLPRPDALGDTSVYRHNKTALRDVVNRGFVRFLDQIRALTPADLEREFEIRQINTKKPVWRWLLWFHEHAAWTLGQTVPYLRLNGVAPPPYLPI